MLKVLHKYTVAEEHFSSAYLHKVNELEILLELFKKIGLIQKYD